MTAGDPGVSGIDPATSELRRLLVKGFADEGARTHALNALLACRVLVATWPSSPEAVRTLTNSDGEQAMPMFSSRHELLTAARRFGWGNADGSMNSRELDAREVLKSALAQGTQFVVLDICAAHVVEFERKEVESALASPRASKPGSSRRSRRPVKLAQVPIAPSKRPPKLAEIDAPFVTERASLMAIEDVVVRPRGRVRVDPRAEPARAPTRDARAVTVPLKTPRESPRESSRAAAGNEHSRGAVVSKKKSRHRGAAEQLEPFAAAEPETHRVQPLTRSAEADTQPLVIEPGIPQASAAVAAAAPVHEPAARMPAKDADKPGPVNEPSPPRHDAAPSLPDLPSLETLPSQVVIENARQQEAREPQPSALAAAEMVVPKTNLPSSQAWPQIAVPSGDGRDASGKGAAQPEGRAAGAMSAARALAGMLIGGDGKRAKPAEAAKAPVEAKAKSTEEADGAAQAEGEPGELRPLEAPLEDALLDQISELLRKYPEVEWACEVSDGSTVPVIGLRVEPTFLMRVDEIKAAVTGAGESRNTPLSVLLLIDPQQMRDARAQGSAFFPWRKRAARPNPTRG